MTPGCPNSSPENGPNCSSENYSNNGPKIPILESGKRTTMVTLCLYLAWDSWTNAVQDTENVLTKRTKLSSEELKDEGISVDKVLDMISSSDLKTIVRKLLVDSVAGPVLSKELLASSGTSLEHALEEAEKLSNDILRESSDAIQDVLDEADEMKGMQSGDAWPSALAEFLPKIRDLADRGPLVDDPELAWETLIHVAGECLLPTSGEPQLETGEEDCDDFHNNVDELMLYICKLQQANGQTAWVRDGERMSEIWILQEKAGAPLDFKEGDWCIYRYQKTLKFLEQFDTVWTV